MIIIAINDAPVLSGNKANLTDGTEDTDYTITEAQLLEGFSDVDGDNLSIVNLTATNGTLTGNANDDWTFTPDTDFNGTVTLNYDVSDGTATTPVTNTFKINFLIERKIRSYLKESTFLLCCSYKLGIRME